MGDDTGPATETFNARRATDCRLTRSDPRSRIGEIDIERLVTV